MTAKEYLSQALLLDHRIDSKIAQIASLNALATKCTSAITGMPHNPSASQSTMADAVCKIIDLQELLKKDLADLVDLKKEIMGVINSIENDEYKTLLEKRYLCFLSWEQIAVDMHYSIEHTIRLHKTALEKVKIPATGHKIS